MKSISKDDIRKAFAVVGLDSMDQTMLSRCVAIANNLHVSAKTMADCWESFSLNKNINELNDHCWASFRIEIQKEADRNPIPTTSRDTVKMEQGAVVQRKGMGKRQVGSPDNALSLPLVTPPAKRANNSTTPGKGTPSAVDAVMSQASASSPVKSSDLNSYIPPKYEERTDAGKVVVRFQPNETIVVSALSTTASTTVAKHAKCGIAYTHFPTNVTQPYRHLFTTMEDRANALDKHLVRMEEIIKERYNIKGHEDMAHHDHMTENDLDIAPLEEVGTPRQDKICCIGRICNAAHSGRINATSVVLQGSKHLGGRRVDLNLSQLSDGDHKTNFSVFPGQIVAVEGMNSTGRKLTAHRICEGAAHDGNKSTAKRLLEYHHSEDFQNGMPLKIMTVAGPYTTSDNLNYDPLYDFMNIVLEEHPDVVIMVGPFVDLRHKDIASGEAMLNFQDVGEDFNVPYETFFANKIAGLLEDYFREEKDAKTQFVLVPSLDDATAEWVYPQAPFQDSLFGGHSGKMLKISGGDELEVASLGLGRVESIGTREENTTGAPFRRVHCVPNPCTMTINEVIIGVTGTDAIFHMSADEANANLVPGSRLARISQHMLQQRSYYPLFPPAPGTSLDLKRMQQWSMPCQPDILVVPSRLATFATPVLGDTVVVNPGQLSKNTTGGTYGIMEIHPMKRDDLETAGGDDVELDHNIANRMALEIRKI